MNIKGRLLMSVSLLVGFSLLDGRLTEEQEFWGSVQPLLGGSALDDGLPKAHGEFLVAGSCHAPAGKPIRRAQVLLQVAEKTKRLAVFGERIWRRGGIGMTEPQEFTSIPLTWEHSYGHETHNLNPLGRGFIPDKKKRGSVYPLPNIEYFNNLIVDTGDRPLPAAPLPIPPHWPQRIHKAGSYDAAWLKERWPWFPDDIDWDYFNVASDDQHIKGFFQGGEAIRITGMHPEFQDIRSQVPRLRPRCFVTMKKDAKASAEHDIFREVDLKADTLWLFPDVMTGALVFHGTTPVQDEEFDDVRYCYTALENPDEPPTPVEDHLYKQWVRAAEVTPNFFGGELRLKEAQSVMAGLLLQRMKSSLQRSTRLILKDQPVMPFSEARMKSAATMTFKAMRRGYDTEVRNLASSPPSNEITRWMNRYASKRDKLYINEHRVLMHTGRLLEQQMQALREAAKHAPQHIKGESLDEMLRSLMPDTKINPWHDQAFPIVTRCREELELNDDCIIALERLGFLAAFPEFSWVGYLREPLRQSPEKWGLPPDTGDFTIPQGLLLPRFDGATLTRLAVLEGWTPELTQAETVALRTFVVPGSDESPLLFAAAAPGAPVVVVPGELEAWYLDEKLTGICSVLALPGLLSGPDASLTAKLDAQASDLLQEAATLIVMLPSGPRPTEKDSLPWLDLHPSPLLVRLSEISTVLEAEERKIDLERLITAHLTPAQLGISEEELQGKGRSPQEVGEEMFQTHLNTMLMAHLDKTEAQVTNPQAAEALKPHLAAARQKILHPEKHKEPASIHAQVKKAKQALLEQRSELERRGVLTPEVDDAFQKTFLTLDQGLQIAQTVRSKLLGKDAENAPPPPQDEIPYELTREIVHALVRKGISLEGQDISGLDLSGLDLSGAKFPFASMDDTNFTGANLAGADFSGVNAEKANFTSADLSGCAMAMLSLNQCNLTGCILSESSLDRASLNDCDCRKASFHNVRFHMSALEKCTLDEADFTGSDFMLSSLSGKAGKAIFHTTTHFQTGITDMELDGCNFAGAKLDNVRFFSCSGTGTVFYEANLNSAMFEQCTLHSADFRRVTMINGTINESEAPKADFTGSILSGSVLEKTDFRGAQFYGVNAKECMFIKSNLEDADLRGSNCMAASFTGSRLINTNLRMANCFSADFRLAVFGQTLLEGADLTQTLLESREGLLQ